MRKLEEGKYYHIYNRGNNRETLFYSSGDYTTFLKKYFHHCYHIFDTYAFCLIRNHFHFLVKVRCLQEQEFIWENYSTHIKGLQAPYKHLSNLFSSHAQSINRRENRTGSLFQKNFKRREIEDREYFYQVFIYIHGNPFKHEIPVEIEDYPYSSFQYYYYDEKPEYPINLDFPIDYFGGIENLVGAHFETFPKSRLWKSP
ncbi:transposase [Balneola sp. MJW-20]|uniref:transposase n=1 Tax=Gracilimonas aurantiaca TaxID=3234185 RepID=UPI003466613A